jgi:dipeptidyl-peptidase-4
VDAYTLDWSSKSAQPIRITQGNEVHSISANSCNFSQSLFIDMSSGIKNPRSYSVGTIEWKPSAMFSTPLLVYAAENPLAEYSLARMEMGQMEHDGNTLYTRTFYPSDFDPNKQYPVVCYLYGGPHAQMIQNRWMGGANLWFHYMAQAGYIVYTVDNRGSSHRGLAFEQATFRNLGTVEMQDQLAVLNLLKSQPYIDSSRCGVHGWSFGGFMTTSLMTRESGAFKVGVAGGPVIDWNYYEIMYTERYMDRPSENAEGYAANSLLNHADKLAGRLLMIHGTLDNVVLWQHSQLFVEQCVKEGVTGLDYFIYPGHEHNVIGRDRAHLYKKVSQYFFEHL